MSARTSDSERTVNVRFHSERPTDIRRATPWHRYRHYIAALPAKLEELSKDLHVPEHGRVLDYGCADVPYRSFFPADVEYVAADLPGNPDASLLLNPDGSVPCDDEDFDAVLSTQVLEHVDDPALYLSECFRALRPGGRLLLSTHGVFIYHPDPEDYWRWTCAGLRRAVDEAGFEVERFEGVLGLLALGLQLTQDAIYWRLPRLVRPAFALIMQSVIAIADRLQGAGSKRFNASVFALVARKPQA
jgi:SAM-dependent methyltransferase